eukprot:TRINITY_DN7709_c0_g1_i3.p2 TRINITY_DN7709_c0_g1~~TRINITY_DN7709_c0_g1_i3.p2  ORF type:complete len:262 (+),score=85.61 TRINITY_DN7709_c0_g1_i3:62-847(+)
MEKSLDPAAEWRGIQEVVRSSFRALHEVVKHQGEAIQRLEAAVQQMPTKHHLESVVAHKASNMDLSNAVAQLQGTLRDGMATKANMLDLTRGFDEQGMAIASKASISEMVVQLEAKVNKAEIAGVLEGRVLTSGDVDAILSQNHKLSGEVAGMELKLEQMSEALRAKADHEVLQSLTSKVSVAHLDGALDSKASKQALESLAGRHTRLAQQHEQLTLSLHRLQGTQAEKVDRESMEAALEHKVDLSQLEEHSQRPPSQFGC